METFTGSSLTSTISGSGEGEGASMFGTRSRRLLLGSACALVAGAALLVVTADGPDTDSGRATAAASGGGESAATGRNVSTRNAQARQTGAPRDHAVLPNHGAPPKPRTADPRPPKQRPGPAGRPMRDMISARMVGRASAPFSSSIVWPVLNGWIVSDKRTFTGVYAGAAGNDRSKGSFGILRQNYIWVTQSLDVVNVVGAGALKITHAPLRPTVGTWAQRRGNLQFTSENGISGTLHLKNDTVTLR
jgi:hypothetical protein